MAKKYNITREQQNTSLMLLDEGDRRCRQRTLTKMRLFRSPFTSRWTSYSIRMSIQTANPMPEKLAKLRPSFIKDGTVTAGDATQYQRWCFLVLVASEDAVKKYNLTPLCEIIGISRRNDPLTMDSRSIPAIRNALNYAGLKLDDMDLVELNEAFAAQIIAAFHELEEERGMDGKIHGKGFNVNGGAIALGTSGRCQWRPILVSLIHEMIKRDAKLGLASLCIGGGRGCAIIVERP